MDTNERDADGPAVLYVDGDPERASETVVALRRAGLVVEVATGPEEAQSAAAAADCAVVEHDPPAVDGFAVFDALARTSPDLPVVFFPSGGDEGVAGRAVDRGVEGYVPRRNGDEAAIRRVVDRVRAVDDGAATGSGEVDFQVKERAMDEAPIGITLADADRPDEPLVYVNDSFEELTGYRRPDILGRNCRFLQGEESDPDAVARIRQAIDAEEPVTVELVNYRADGERFWNRLDVAPIYDDGEVTHFVGFQTDVTERVRAERRAERRAEELAAERAALERLVDRIDGVVGDVTTALVEATDRGAVQRRVCERLAEVDPYAAAWIGEVDHAAGTVVPAASVGVDPAEVPLHGDDPVARAVRERTLQRSTLGAPASPGDEQGATDDAPALVAVPLVYRDRVEGVLVVHGTDDEALDDRETTVLAALGRSVGTALDALRTRRVLEADASVELELSIRDPALFVVDASARADCRLEFAGAGYGPGGDQQLLFGVQGAPAATVRDLLADHDGVADVAVLTADDDGGLLEVTAADPSIVTLFAEYGAETESLTAVDGEAHVTLGLSTDDDARRLLDRLESLYEGVDLRALRDRERPPRTKREFLAALDERLTDRQRTALRKAYAGGYFDRQRTVTGDELADSMGITRSTFHQHLRSAQRKLLTEFFDGG